MQMQNPAHPATEPWPRPGLAWYAVVVLVIGALLLSKGLSGI